MCCCISTAYTADCSSFVHEGEEHTIECNITNCTIPVSRDNVLWCLNYCGTNVGCDLSRSLCINSTGITNIVGGETPTSIRNNIEVTNSGGLHNALVTFELRNTTYNCSVVDREGNMCGPQRFAFIFRSSSKLTCLQISCFFFLWLGEYFYTHILCIFPHISQLCTILLLTHTSITYSHNRVHVPFFKYARRSAGT